MRDLDHLCVHGREIACPECVDDARVERLEREATREVAAEMLTEEQQRHIETQKALIIANTTQVNLHSVITAKNYAIAELERDYAPEAHRQATEAEKLATERAHDGCADPDLYAATVAENTNLRMLLRDIEWNGGLYDQGRIARCCPCCGREPVDGHNAVCRIDAFLAPKGGA